MLPVMDGRPSLAGGVRPRNAASGGAFEDLQNVESFPTEPIKARKTGATPYIILSPVTLFGGDEEEG